MAEMYGKQGKDYYISGMYAKSVEFFDKALNISPNNWSGRAVMFGNRAASLLMLTRFHYCP